MIHDRCYSAAWNMRNKNGSMLRLYAKRILTEMVVHHATRGPQGLRNLGALLRGLIAGRAQQIRKPPSIVSTSMVTTAPAFKGEDGEFQ